MPITSKGKNILLMLLPYWDPQVPPVGIACLKGFLRHHGYRVKTVDANVDLDFRGFYIQYFDLLKEYIPAEKRRHLYNIGYDVMRNHLMAHWRKGEEGGEDYLELVQALIYNTFYTTVEQTGIQKLSRLGDLFYRRLKEYVLSRLAAEEPDILGLSVYSGTLPASLFTLELCRRHYPGIGTVIGGGVFAGELCRENINFKAFLERVPYIDAVILGEGEEIFLQYLQGKLPRIGDPPHVYSLADIGHRPMNLSVPPLPDFTDFDIPYYPQMAGYTSRSCPFQCSFCVETVYWGKYRKKDPVRIADELIRLYKQFGRQLFLMCDSLLNPVIEDLSAEFITREESIYWGGYLRASAAVSDTARTMQWRKGGFYRARLGVESGSQKILDAMDKKISVNQIKSSIAALAAAGIKTTTYWVIGYPGETEKDFSATLDVITQLKDDLYEADCNPFWYFAGGQVDSAKWNQQNSTIPLYPDRWLDMLMLQTWTLDGKPCREVVYDRVNRFIDHCRRLNVPNPYSLEEIHRADDRWRRLHPNAVPPLSEFGRKDSAISENKEIDMYTRAQNTQQFDANWEF